MEDTGWRRNKYGGWFNVNNIKDKSTTNEYMNNKIRKSVKKENFDSIDADNPTEFKQKRKEYIDKNLQLEEASTKDKTRTKIKAILDNKIVGTIDYDTKDDSVNIVYVHVDDDYRRSGIATKMYKSLQQKIGNKDIHFGEFTPEGKKLVEKIGVITKQNKNKDGFVHYWGKIKV